MTGPRRRRPEWDVPSFVPTSSDVDERLRAGVGRTGRLQVLIDHDTATPGRCPRCGWVATSTRRDCPSRVIAKALIEHKPFPAWLAHLTDDIPGARVRNAAEARERQRAVLDDEPGLFAAPQRMPEPRRRR